MPIYTVSFKVVEFEHLPEIITWVIEHLDEGADMSGIIGDQDIWITVPESCFDEFIAKWGRYVSAR